jgi:DNA-binding MarR family transcriptional regulator
VCVLHYVAAAGSRGRHDERRLRSSNIVAVANTKSKASRETLDFSLLHERLGYNLHRANAHMRKCFIDATNAWGILPPHYAALALIEANAGMTQAELCAALLMLPPNVVTLLRPLEEQRWISRSVRAADRRTTALTLTAKGKRVRRVIGSRLHELESELLAGFTEHDRATLNALLIHVATSAETH